MSSESSTPDLTTGNIVRGVYEVARFFDDDLALDADQDDRDPATCKNGDPECRGVEDLLEGRFPCFSCYFDAPDEVLAKFNAMRLAREENVATINRGP